MSEVGAQLRAAADCARRGDEEGMVAACREVLASDPERPEAHFLLASAAARAGELEAAAGHLGRYLAARPGDADAWHNLGVVEQQRGEPAAAMEAYARALAARPGHLAARVNLAALQRAGGQPAKAVALLRAHPEGADADPRLALALARAEAEAGDLAAACETLSAALARNEDAALHDALGVLENRRGRRGEALAAARRATGLAPGRAGYWYNLAAIASRCTAREDLAAGAEAARQCLALEPAHAGAWHCLGLVRSKLGEDAAAAEALEHAVRLAPESSRHAVDLGDHHLARGRLDRAVAALEAAAGLDDPQGEADRQLGIALLRRGEPAAALARLEAAERRAPADQRTIAHRAVALQALGRHAEAQAYLGLDRHLHRVRLAPPEHFASLAAFNRALAHDIAGHSLLRWEPIGLAARGGALTDDLLADRTPAIEGFALRLREAIEALRRSLRPDPDDPFLRHIPGPDYRLDIWATLVHGGGHIDTHIHEESWLSGAYYVELPPDLGSAAEDGAGWIEFGRPHAEIGCPAGTRLERIRPEEGLLLLFPSYLFHRTLPHAGPGRRISISFDLTPS